MSQTLSDPAIDHAIDTLLDHPILISISMACASASQDRDLRSDTGSCPKPLGRLGTASGGHQ